MKKTTAALAACRIGDFDRIHCSRPKRAEGSPDVFVTGIPWSRMGDRNDPHLRPCPPDCCTHRAPIAKGSRTVFINGKGAGRVTDKVLACTEVFTGAPTVFCGG